MSSLPKVVRAAIAFVLLIPTSEPLVAQTHRADYESETRLGWKYAAPGLAGPVLDIPFTAEAVTIWRPHEVSERSEWRATTRYYRDRSGRVRIDQTFVDHADGRNPQRIVIASDPNGPTAVVVDCLAHSVSEYPRPVARLTLGGHGRLVLPQSMNRFVTFLRPQSWRAYYNVAGDDEALGEKMLLGVQATGTRAQITLPIGAFQRNHAVQIMDERWVSSDLELLMSSRTEDSEYRIVEHRVTTLSRDNPPAELFEIPAGYSAIPPKYSICFSNPYIPQPWPSDVNRCPL